jgi:hypothetical protein
MRSQEHNTICCDMFLATHGQGNSNCCDGCNPIEFRPGSPSRYSVNATALAGTSNTAVIIGMAHQMSARCDTHKLDLVIVARASRGSSDSPAVIVLTRGDRDSKALVVDARRRRVLRNDDNGQTMNATISSSGIAPNVRVATYWCGE